MRHRTSAFLFLTVLLFTALPCLLYAHRFPDYAPSSFFANDAFYYLDVARNSQQTPFYTFDGTHPTNGFHPVWQFLLYLGVKIGYLDFSHPLDAMRRLYAANLAILSIAWASLSLTIAKHLRHKWLALISVCPGWMWFPVAICAPNYLASWSYLNGMETSVELLFLALALLSYRPSMSPARWMPPMAFLLGMTVLSRLDDVFFLIPLLALFFPRDPPVQMPAARWSALIPVAMIAAYLLYNLKSVGTAMPVSGAAKAGFAAWGNTRELLKVFLPVSWDKPLSLAHLGYSVFAEGFMRCFQMCFPMLVCGLFLYRRRHAPMSLVMALSIGVVLKGLYNFLFVALWSQGHWYYGASVFACNLILAMIVDDMLALRLAKMYPRGTPVALRWTYFCAEALVILFSFNAFANNKLSTGYGFQTEEVLAQRERIMGMLHAFGVARFIEVEDGKLGFATGLHSMSGIGLTLDAEAGLARKRGDFFKLSSQRGYRFILTDGAYADALEQAASHAQKGLYGIRDSEFTDYAIRRVADDPRTDVRLYEVSPNGNGR
jgi:hypothetical protein